jgi:mono/diheme cytochrome c family protein
MSQGPEHIDYQETPDLTEVHAAIQREHKDPSADVTPVPLWVTVLCGAAVCWAGAYVGMFHGGFSGSVYNEYDSSPVVLFPLPPSTNAKPGPAVAEDMVAIGRSVFQGNCQSCHQPNGMGQAGAIPPLAGSEWVLGSEKRVAAIVLKGLIGPVKVKGATFNGVMAPWEAALSDKKIAAVLTYVRQEWGNKAGEIAPAQIAAARKEFAARKTSWSEAELLQIPEDAKLEGGAPAAAPGAPAGTSAAPAPAPAGGTDVAKLTEEGKKNYMAICVACHQPTGQGLPMVFPPLVKSEYVNGSPERFAAMILKGVMGPITVEGKPYNNIMPAQEAMLSDEKIAGILTFVRSNFQNTSGPVTPDIVAAARKKHADRKTPWTEADLKALGADAAAPAPAAAPAAPQTEAPAK